MLNVWACGHFDEGVLAMFYIENETYESVTHLCSIQDV